MRQGIDLVGGCGDAVRRGRSAAVGARAGRCARSRRPWGTFFVRGHHVFQIADKNSTRWGVNGVGSNPRRPILSSSGCSRCSIVLWHSIDCASWPSERVRWPILAKFSGILFLMPRVIAVLVASTFLVSCSRVSGGIVGDYAPEWLGGMPKGVPPRPGTPEYDAFMKARQAEADRDKSKDPARPKSEAPKGLQ